MTIFEVPTMVCRTNAGSSMIRLRSSDPNEQFLVEIAFCEAIDCAPSGEYCRNELHADCGVSASDWATLRQMFPTRGVKAKVKVDYTDTSSDVDPINSVTLNDSFVICFGSAVDKMMVCKSKRITGRFELDDRGTGTVTQNNPAVVIHIHAGGGGGCCCCSDDE